MGRAAPVALWGRSQTDDVGDIMGRSILLWLLGVPIPISSCLPFSGAEAMAAPSADGFADEATNSGASPSAAEAMRALSPAGPRRPSLTPFDLRSAVERADLLCGVALDQPGHAQSRQRLLLELDGLGILLQSNSLPISEGIATAFHLVLIQAGIVRICIDLSRHMPADAGADSSLHHAMRELRRGFDRLRQAMILAGS